MRRSIVMALAMPVMLWSRGLAHGAEPEHGEEPGSVEGGSHHAAKHRPNVLGVRAMYAVHLLRESPETDHLGGVVLSYERMLIEERLSLQIAKPFLFGAGRFDSPFETVLKLMNRWGDVEPFVALGYTVTLRFFDGQREAVEGTPNSLSFGLLGVVGAVYWFQEATGFEIEVDYAQHVVGPIVDGELTVSAGLAFAF